MRDEIARFFEQLLPEAMERFLEETLGEAIPRLGDEGRFRVLAAGRFSGRIVGDLLTYARNQEIDAALILVERDVMRILYFKRGCVIGADSNVLFERLGRVLGQAGILQKSAARELSDIEEREGMAAAAARISPDAAEWGLERRVWEIAAGLYYMPHAHYILVDGEPNLGDLPRFRIPPMELAVEGLRRYDEWRNRSQSGKKNSKPSESSIEDVTDIEEIEEIVAAEEAAKAAGAVEPPEDEPELPPAKRPGAASLPEDAEKLKQQISDLLGS